MCVEKKIELGEIREREDGEVKGNKPRGGRVEDKGEKEEGRGRNADRGRGKNISGAA